MYQQVHLPTQHTEKVHGEILDQRTKDIFSTRVDKRIVGLGPNDLCILYDQTHGETNGTYHYVLGYDTGSAISISTYVTLLLKELHQHQYVGYSDKLYNMWRSFTSPAPNEDEKKRHGLQRGVFCAFNFFENVDLRIEVTLPGKVITTCIGVDGEKKITEEMWNQTCLCSLLRYNHIIQSSLYRSTLPKNIHVCSDPRSSFMTPERENDLIKMGEISFFKAINCGKVIGDRSGEVLRNYNNVNGLFLEAISDYLTTFGLYNELELFIKVLAQQDHKFEIYLREPSESTDLDDTFRRADTNIMNHLSTTILSLNKRSGYSSQVDTKTQEIFRSIISTLPGIDAKNLKTWLTICRLYALLGETDLLYEVIGYVDRELNRQMMSSLVIEPPVSNALGIETESDSTLPRWLQVEIDGIMLFDSDRDNQSKMLHPYLGELQGKTKLCQHFCFNDDPLLRIHAYDDAPLEHVRWKDVVHAHIYSCLVLLHRRVGYNAMMDRYYQYDDSTPILMELLHILENGKF
jgi:hypothetical protein